MTAWSTVDPNFEARVHALFQATPFVEHLGIRVVRVAPGECVTQLGAKAHHLQQNGYVHAGVLATLADHSAGGAACTVAPASQGVLSVEFKINLLRPAPAAELTCTARVLKAGRTLSVVEAEVTGSEAPDKLLCKATVTLAMVPAER